MKRLNRTALGAAALLAYAGCSIVNDVDQVQPAVTNGTGEPCGAGEGFCDGACIDVSADAANCGACGVTCPDGIACVAGACDLSCETGVACGAGCVDIATDPANCGGCGRVCETAANQAATCDDGKCSAACADGFGDCNLDPSDGCETDVMSTAAHCGSCDQSCLQPGHSEGSCSAGVCGFGGVCEMGFDDCDNDPGNGCEERLAGNQNHCGQCGNACGADQFCRINTCAPLVVVAADGVNHAQGNLYSVNVTNGQVSVIGALSAPYSALGFLNGVLFGVTDQGDVNQINLMNADETFVANTGRGPRGIGQIAGDRMAVCRESPHAYQVLDVMTGEFSTLSNECPHNATLFGDREAVWAIGFGDLSRYDEFGNRTQVVLHNDNNPIRGATWHLGQVLGFRCGNGSCQTGGPTHLIRVDPADGAVTVLAALPAPNSLHALASPRPLN